MKKLYLNLIDIIAYVLNKVFSISFIIIPKIKRKNYRFKNWSLVDNKYSLMNVLKLEYGHIDFTNNEDIRILVKKLKPYTVDKELIRFGSQRDGGYLIPNDLDEITACFSPGVEEQASFEEDCLKKGIKCFLADATVSNAPVKNENIQFLKKYLNAYNDENNITLEKWVIQSLNGEKGDLILQMDIEGAELETIIATSRDIIDRFRIIIIEVHTMQSLILRSYFQVFNAMIMKLLKNHTCIHIHPNNNTYKWKLKDGLEIPITMELTFIRNDRIKTKSPTNIFPHPLDTDNNQGIPPLHLPKCWYE